MRINRSLMEEKTDTISDHNFLFKNKKKIGLYGAGAIVALILTCGSMFTVEQTERCYVTRFREVVNVKNGPIGPGLHFKLPFIEDVDCMQVSRTTDNLGIVPVTTKDTFTVEMTVGVTTEVPENSVYKLLYETGKQGRAEVNANINPNIINTLRNILGRYELIQLAGEEQGQVRIAFQNAVTSMLERDWGVKVLEVQLSINKLPAEYNQRMIAAQSAQAAIVLAQRQQQQAKIEADTVKIAAEGQANQRAAIADGQRREQELLAQGAAAARKLQSEAEALAIRIQGEAQADAAKRMAEALATNPNLVNLEQARRWNGALPTNMYSGSPIPFLNLSSSVSK